MTVIQVANDAQFLNELHDAGVKLVVVDFFATWSVILISTINMKCVAY